LNGVAGLEVDFEPVGVASAEGEVFVEARGEEGGEGGEVVGFAGGVVDAGAAVASELEAVGEDAGVVGSR
jgi:hypothetical protein